MKKSELVTAIATELGMPKGQVKQVIDKAFDKIMEQVESGNKVSIQNYCNLVPRERQASTKTKETGEVVEVPYMKFALLRPAKKRA